MKQLTFQLKSNYHTYIFLGTSIDFSTNPKTVYVIGTATNGLGVIETYKATEVTMIP